ncbi:helix-turn-helix domain-containing protein [Kordia jejudonensis]|uniref:helix-turn-helix domain-containing protein n=1 Tax=Kordia jejudonensis TaxID=1348245 RepID=UPI0006297FCA|nr:helix-turn-helix transcriptional regulator [Kordia jejudonensis]
MTDLENYIEKNLENLGNRLKDLRKQKGYRNYEQFAFENNISRAQYGRYENGQDLRFSSLLKVLKALDVSLEDFFKEGFEAADTANDID